MFQISKLIIKNNSKLLFMKTFSLIPLRYSLNIGKNEKINYLFSDKKSP